MFDFIARPFGQLLMFLYESLGNYGLAILVIAIVIKVILLPFQMKAKRGQMRQARLQPKIAEINKKHGANKAKVNEEMAKMYKEEGVNPASGCLWGFLPLPIMFALFFVIRSPLTMMMGVAAEHLQEGGIIYNRLLALNFEPQLTSWYVEIEQAQFITANFREFALLNIENLREISFHLFPQLDLGAQPQWNFLWSTDWTNSAIWVPGFMLFLIPLLSCGMQFVSTAINRKFSPTPAVTEGAGKSMQSILMLMPLMSLWFGFMLPAALGFYWTIGTVCQIAQDLWLTKRYTKILDAEDEERNRQRKKKEAEIEAKRVESERKRAEGVVEKNPNISKRKKQKSDKQGQRDKAAEWEKKNAPPDKEEKVEPGRVGNRRYARGRAYDPDRYGPEGAASDAEDDPDSEARDREPDGEERDAKGGAAADAEERDGEERDAKGGDAGDDVQVVELDDTGEEDEGRDDDGDVEDDGDDGDDDDDSPESTVRFETTRFDSDDEK